MLCLRETIVELKLLPALSSSISIICFDFMLCVDFFCVFINWFFALGLHLDRMAKASTKNQQKQQQKHCWLVSLLPNRAVWDKCERVCKTLKLNSISFVDVDISRQTFSLEFAHNDVFIMVFTSHCIAVHSCTLSRSLLSIIVCFALLNYCDNLEIPTIIKRNTFACVLIVHSYESFESFVRSFVVCSRAQSIN